MARPENFADRHPNLAGGVYGTIIVTSLVAAFSEDQHATSFDILLSVSATVVVFWLAHVYAGVIADSVGARRAAGRREIVEAMRYESPIVGAAVPLCAALALGALGMLSDDAAFALAMALGVVSLAGWGVLLGRHLGHGWFPTAATAVASATLGLVIVALKLVVH